MTHPKLPRPASAASLVLLSGLALAGLVPSAPASRSGAPGGLAGDAGGTAGCANVGAGFAPAQVLQPGASICSSSTGVNFTIGYDAQNQPIQYSQPVCPSDLLYRPSHRPKVAKLGHRAIQQGQEPYLRQKFFCNVNPSFSFCDTDGGPVPQAQGARNYVDEACDAPGSGVTAGGAAR